MCMLCHVASPSLVSGPSWHRGLLRWQVSFRSPQPQTHIPFIQTKHRAFSICGGPTDVGVMTWSDMPGGSDWHLLAGGVVIFEDPSRRVVLEKPARMCHVYSNTLYGAFLAFAPGL